MSGDSRNFATPLASHGLNPKGSVHWNLGWEILHETAVELGEAKLTADEVYTPRTTQQFELHQDVAAVARSSMAFSLCRPYDTYLP